MPLSTDITLPIGQPPIFPDLCVRCLSPHPDSGYIPRGGSISWLSATFLPVPGKSIKPIAPACRGCARRMVWARRLRLAADFAVLVLVVIGVETIMRNTLPGWPRSIRLVIAVASYIPYLAIMQFFPPCYDVTQFPKTIQYEFRSEKYAAMFAAHNA